MRWGLSKPATLRICVALSQESERRLAPFEEQVREHAHRREDGIVPERLVELRARGVRGLRQHRHTRHDHLQPAALQERPVHRRRAPVAPGPRVVDSENQRDGGGASTRRGGGWTSRNGRAMRMCVQKCFASGSGPPAASRISLFCVMLQVRGKSMEGTKTSVG